MTDGPGDRGFRGPLSGSYGAAVALVVCALVPYLSLTAAMQPLEASIGRDLQLSGATLQLTTSLANAAYAFGTVLAVQLAQRLPARRMLIVYVSAFVVAAVLAAWAPDGGVFVGAFVVEGLCTSLMLIAAVPPLVVGWPPGKMRWTGAIMNLCIFGAVAGGPSIGSFLASRRVWHPLFWTVAAIATVALVFSFLTYGEEPPHDTDAPWDAVAIVLAAAGCTSAFFGAGELEIHHRAVAVAIAPLAAGAALVLVLVVDQYRKREPLMPVRALATTLPAAGILTALCASAAAFGLMELALTALRTRAPSHVAVLFLPEFGAALATAAAFGLLFTTRFTPVLAGAGLLLIAAAAALLTGVAGGGDGRALLASALIGLGVGASVSPALFVAGFSLASAQIQRVFALIELLRGVGAFLFAPVLLYVASVLGASRSGGVADGAWICLGVVLAGATGAVALFTLGGGRLQVPDLEQFAAGEPAWHSPPLLAAVRE